MPDFGNVLNIIILVIVPALSGLGTWALKSFIGRMNDMDSKINDCYTKQEVKDMFLAYDKIIKEDITDMKTQINILLSKDTK